MRRTRVALIVVLITLGAAAALFVSLRKAPAPQSPTTTTRDLPELTPLPPQHADAHEFALTASTSLVEGRRHVWLRTGDAAALLKVAAPTDYAGDQASGRVSIEAPTRDPGARFIEDISLWLRDPQPPAADPTPLAPLFGTYVRQDSELGWERLRITFARGASRAQLLLKLSQDGTKASISEVSPEYRDTLLFLLAGALRDGFERRTPDTDSNFAGESPRWSEFHPLGGSEIGVRTQAWPVNEGAWGTIFSSGATSVVWWNDLAKSPVEVTRIEGLVTKLAPSPKGRRSVVAVVRSSHDYPAGAKGFASDDPVELLLLDASKGKPITLIPFGQQVDYAPAIEWSPLGTAVAVETRQRSLTNVEESIRIFDGASGAELGATPASEESVLLEWSASGISFARTDGQTDGSLALFRWSPSHGDPKPAFPDYHKSSPDGRYGFNLVQGAIEITGPTGSSPFPTIYTDDRKAIEYAATTKPWWLGPHTLLLVSDDLLSLDLSTRKLSYAFPPQRTLLIQGTSPDGRTVIVRDENDRLLWSVAQP